MTPAHLNLADMQGLLIRAYGYLGEACYLLLRFGDVTRTKTWLRQHRADVTPANDKPGESALHIAFTNEGLFKLVPPERLDEPFSREFTEGMVTEQRRRILGDLDTNRPERWQWGGPGQPPIHAILLLYARDKPTLEQQCGKIRAGLAAHAIDEVRRLDTSQPPDHKEHFGFRDGLSQPRLAGLSVEDATSPASSSRPDDDQIKPGEFILGYANEYDEVPFSPKLRVGSGEVFDLGRNGSYLVFRQLRQDVKAFWEFVQRTVRDNPHFGGRDPVYVAAKLVGRWPNGNPLTLTTDPNADPLPADALNQFRYKAADEHGLRCPIGAHIRKTNPRDGIDNDPAGSLQISKRHRILRRGRSFGEPLAPTMQPADLLASTVAGERGLYFIGLNANLARQFEFVQNAWANNAKFDGLYNDVDPIVGFAFTKGHYVPCQFTIQHEPVRKTVPNIPQFVFVEGGAYFFMPGLKALEVIATQL